jgi:hypothetical protein
MPDDIKQGEEQIKVIFSAGRAAKEILVKTTCEKYVDKEAYLQTLQSKRDFFSNEITKIEKILAEIDTQTTELLKG